MSINEQTEEALQETTGSSETPEPEPKCSITVSDDKLTAYLNITEIFRPEITLEEIKNCFETQGIKYGIVDDAIIIDYCRANPPPEEPLKIAYGTPPEAGHNAEVKYFFDTAPLKIGTQTESGGIDFADRGKIPQVNGGDLLAEKIPLIPGTPGTDIFGHPIPVAKPDDITVSYEKGVKKSEDGLKFFATINGRPVLTKNGKLNVFPDLRIEGDVDLETGHIEFDGPIEVSGVLQSGFRIKGKSLKIQAIDNAEVDIAEDLFVLKGIIQGKVKVGKHLHANHIDMSSLRVVGDVVVGKEIIGSTIVTSGKCIVERGDILSSQITAKMGVEAAEIGSEASKACTIVVGIDGLASDEVKNLTNQVTAKKNQQQRLKSQIEELTKKSEAIQEELGTTAQEEDHVMVQKRTLEEKIKNDPQGAAPAKAAQTEKVFTALNAKIDQIRKKIETLFAEDDQANEHIAAHQNEIQILENEIADLLEEIKCRNESLVKGDGRTEVKVSGVLAANTTIRGPHASLTTKEDFRRILIKEAASSDPDAENPWEMVVSNL